MNIVDLLCDEIQKNDNYFFNSCSGANTRANFARIALDFLKKPPSDGMRDFLAGQIVYYALVPHAKGHVVASFGDILNSTELYGAYKYEKNRKHLGHIANTFLLGLLFYHKLPSLRKRIEDEMRKTTDMLSGGDLYGEFLFRWCLSSLMHDLGNGISLFKDNAHAIDEYLFHIMIRLNANWPTGHRLSVEYLLGLSRNKNALQELDRVASVARFQGFFKQLKKEPYLDILYDHGLVSALLILKSLDEMYSRHDEEKRPKLDDRLVSFHRKYFDNSVMEAAYAVGIHNLDFYPDKYRSSWTGKLYDADAQPFAFLLKLADTLQEWDKVQARDKTNYIKPDEIELQFEDGSIVFQNYPKLDELKKKVDKFFNVGDLLRL